MPEISSFLFNVFFLLVKHLTPSIPITQLQSLISESGLVSSLLSNSTAKDVRLETLLGLGGQRLMT